MNAALKMPEDPHLAALADVIAPGDSDAVTALLAYFDESGSDKLLCVAGYLFRKSALKKFERDWRVMRSDFGVPYFRMSECAHGNKAFSTLSLEQRIEIETRAIGLIKKYASVGFGVSVYESTFKENAYPSTYVKTGYEFCAWIVLVAVRTWLNDHGALGDMAYVFEAGHSSQGTADALMHKIFSTPYLRESYRYVSHTFMGKKDAGAIQAADLLAWLFLKECKRIEGHDKRPPRADFVSLMQLHHEVLFPLPPNIVKERLRRIEEANAVRRTLPR